MIKKISRFISQFLIIFSILISNVHANPLLILEGNADQNDDRKITNGELLAYMDDNISQKASELGRQQNPSLAGDPNKVLSTY